MTGIPRDKREPSAPLPVVDIDDRKIVDAARPQPACAADDTRDLDGDGRIDFADSAAAFDNPDHVAITIHNYRWRLGLAEGESA